MTTTAPDAQTDGLLTNAEFIAACNAWQRDGRAFLGFADWLTERGLTGEAAAWAWASERKQFDFNGAVIYTCPNGYSPPHWWFGINRNYNQEYTFQNVLPYELCGHFGFGSDFPTFPAAIHWFLARSVEVYGDAGPPSS